MQFCHLDRSGEISLLTWDFSAPHAAITVIFDPDTKLSGCAVRSK
jgi:hypothetical protein